MLKPEQHARLAAVAPTAAAIVETDRQITALTDRIVTPFDPAQRVELRELLRDRRMLRTRAAQLWGHAARGDGTARA